MSADMSTDSQGELPGFRAIGSFLPVVRPLSQSRQRLANARYHVAAATTR